MNAVLKCIDPGCGLEYPIDSTLVECERGHLLDVKYPGSPPESLKEVFRCRRDPGGSIFNESGVWRFRELLNFCSIDTEDAEQCAAHLVSLDGAEGRQSKPYRMGRVSKFTEMEPDSLWLQPEGYNPSGSFKDNGMATAVTHARMVSAGKIVCASTGNTSASAGMFAANEGIECDVYIPAGQIAPGKLSQAYQFGAQIIEVDGNFDDALRRSLDEARGSGGYTVNSINPFRIEGQKTIPYRALEQLDWEAPDWIVYPGGALGNTSSCGKALMELHEWGWIGKIPRIAVINAEGARTLSDLYNDRGLRWNGGKPDTGLIEDHYAEMDRTGAGPRTRATAIQIGRPANILKGLRALEYTDGVVTTVSDTEMLDGMSAVGLNGFDCEMASGATPAGIKKLVKEGVIKRDDTVVGILTGRQKDAMLPVEYHSDPSNMFARPPRAR
ncbi:threonine synthase [Cenarchaeum symbiosum A]|uniref:Threonine synthase n=1 Tax=Cenarchaeum symbiosum (strain A) TaxID=414004 RepID=A0RUZ8_CENSY|nr:threonine synthase [Cenarchaeum symbiosum A]